MNIKVTLYGKRENDSEGRAKSPGERARGTDSNRTESSEKTHGIFPAGFQNGDGDTSVPFIFPF